MYSIKLKNYVKIRIFGSAKEFFHVAQKHLVAMDSNKILIAWDDRDKACYYNIISIIKRIVIETGEMNARRQYF